MKRNISHQFNHSFNHHFLSLSLSHLLTLSSSIHFSLFSSHLWHSHQLLLWWVTPHNHYVHLMMHSAMESKVKKFQNLKNQSNIKTYLLRNQVKVTSKYPNEFVRLQSFKAHTLSLTPSLSLSLSDLWGVGVEYYTP